MNLQVFGASKWVLLQLPLVASPELVPKSDAQNITAITNSTAASGSPSMLPNMTSTKPTTLPVTTDTTKPSTIPINSHLTRFTPQLCGQGRDIGIDAEPIQFLSFKPLHITQERATVKLDCSFCVTQPIEWSSVLWYKDDKLLENGVDTLIIEHARHSYHEGMYRCDVSSSTNHTATGLMTLIINKDPEFSMIPSVWAKNVSYTQATKVLWHVRGGGIFDAIHVTVKLRQRDQSSWLYVRKYNQFVSGSTEFYDLDPSTVYIANVTAVSSYGGHPECRSFAFWSNARNSTEFDSGILKLDYCTRQLLGLITGLIGLICTLVSIYCCCFNPACEHRNHQGYASTPTNDSAQLKYDNKHEEKELDVDSNTATDALMKV